MKHCHPAALLLCREASPWGTSPLWHQRFAALPVLLPFPRDALHPDSFFTCLRWQSWGKRYLDRSPKTSACHLPPSLPTSVLPCLSLPLPGLCRDMDLFGLFLFQLWLETQGAGGRNATVNAASPGRRAAPQPGTDTGRVLLKKAQGNSFYQ